MAAMATDKGKAAFAFVKKYLEKKPGAPFAEVSKAAEKKGHKVWPIVYGRAQLLLGQAGDPKPKKAAGNKAGRGAKRLASPLSATGRRGPGRPRKAVSGAPSDAVESLIIHIRELEQERDELRHKLAQVRDLVGGF